MMSYNQSRKTFDKMTWGINEGMQRWSCRWYIFNAPKIYQVMSKSPPKCCLSSRLGRGTLAKRATANASNFSGIKWICTNKKNKRFNKHIYIVFINIYTYICLHIQNHTNLAYLSHEPNLSTWIQLKQRYSKSNSVEMPWAATSHPFFWAASKHHIDWPSGSKEWQPLYCHSLLAEFVDCTSI